MPLVDLAGNPRIINGNIDIGAYEYFTVSIDKETMPYSINIYPNPASENIIIEGLQIGQVEIINLQGQVVKNIDILDPKTDIDISKLTDGVYMIKVKMEDGIFVRKLLKQ